MHDPRLDKLANVLTTHSTKVQPGEFVLIEGIDIPQEMVIALIRAVRDAGGIPLVELKQNRIQREIILGGDDAGIKLIGEYEIYRMEKVQAYIGIRGSHNITEMSDVPSEAMQRYQKHWHATAQRYPGAAHKMGRPTLAPSSDGAAGTDEHRSVRGLLFRRLHA